MKIEDAKRAVSNAVLAHYLETGEPADVTRLAIQLGWSTHQVYRVIREAGGAVEGTIAQREERARFARSYGGQIGTTRVWEYLPTLWRLRAELLACRAAREVASAD